MDSHFKDDEKLYRAVREIQCDGDTISPAAFLDKRGLSVYRGNDRSDAEVVNTMRGKLIGRIVAVTVKDCRAVGAEIVYLPSRDNPYHSEIHGGKGDKIILSMEQSDYLTNAAITVGTL